jgi:hypothetical protein
VNFLGIWSGYDLIINIFSETEGPVVIFPNVQGPLQNLEEAQGAKCKMVRNYGFLGFIFQWKIRWTGSTARGPGGAARVHRGPRQRGQEGAVAPWRRTAHGR